MLENGSNIVRHLDVFQSNLQEFKKAILNNDADHLKELIAKARRLKEELDQNANSPSKVKE